MKPLPPSRSDTLGRYTIDNPNVVPAPEFRRVARPFDGAKLARFDVGSIHPPSPCWRPTLAPSYRLTRVAQLRTARFDAGRFLSPMPRILLICAFSAGSVTRVEVIYYRTATSWT